MSVYGRIFAAIYDPLLAQAEQAGLADRRRDLLARATGRVIELGAGTGLNIGHYPDGLEELVFTEPEEPMAKRLERRLAQEGRRARVVRASAESLPFEDGTFDTAVCTLVLCTVSDPQRSLSEIERVLRPGGKLLFLEHVRSDDPRTARWQDRLHWPWLKFGHGCNCNRPTLDTIKAARFDVKEVEQGVMPKSPPIVRPLIAGYALAP